ncbi:MAG TPA: hypothetical protein VK053_12970, partial [Jiangellaceae bacterium]|nr:hypothetical protein [Jiangellaceae bacterium]
MDAELDTFGVANEHGLGEPFFRSDPREANPAGTTAEGSPSYTLSLGDKACADFGEFFEAGSFVGGEDNAVGGAGGGRDNEVVRTSLTAGALNMGQQRGVVICDDAVVLVDG